MAKWPELGCIIHRAMAGLTGRRMGASASSPWSPPGSVAGILGSLLGIGGGVFLVPFLNAGLGLDFRTAAATGLMTVIATSSVVSAGKAGQQLINMRLCMVLEVATTVGGLIAAFSVAYLSNQTLNLIFAVVTTAIAVLMLTRLDRRNVLEATVSTGLARRALSRR